MLTKKNTYVESALYTKWRDTMIEDLMKLKTQIDTMIETYKDLHPDDLGIGSTVGIASMTDEDYQQYDKEYIKTRALKRVKEGYYENKFSKSQRKKTTGSSKGSDSLCVYGDS